MSKVTNLTIKRRWATRPNGNTDILGIAWAVKKGEEYDLVQFEIEDIPNVSWSTSLAFPIGMSAEDICRETQDYADRYITEKDIAGYKEFLHDIEQFGCE